ncbi:MAG TPA: glycerol-3-phosphate dehydrogenase/oxidase [Thermoplasmata archaeon]
MSEEFSFRTRAENLDRIAREALDVLVVGGGIVGAGVARDAASRGLRTALVERADFGSGTSGKTSRLIHGGLRYLRKFKVGLVRQAVRERDLLVARAPGLVHPLPFVLPAYRDRGPSQRVMRFGLFLYDFLSKDKKLPRRVWLSSAETRAREPRLNPGGLEGAAIYYDAWADDARLVLAVVRDAARAGAVVANHTEVVGVRREGGRVSGAEIRDRLGDWSMEVRASVVVNATGVWLDRLRWLRDVPTLRPTKGIHIFLPRKKIGNRHALALTARRDGRVVFVLPWGNLTLVGTTDTDFHGDPDRVLPDRDDVAYLLDAVNDAFPESHAGPEDVVSAYAGLRPLLRRGTADASESDISREHSIFEDTDGLISVAGGKLTTHRAMAEQVVDLVCARLRRHVPTRTVAEALGPSLDPLETFMELGFDEETALHLQGRHSAADVRSVLETPVARERIAEGMPHVWAEVALALRQEMATSLEDTMVRRLGLFYEASDQGLSVAVPIAERMAPELGWDVPRVEREVDAYRDLVAAHRAFKGDHGR